MRLFIEIHYCAWASCLWWGSVLSAAPVLPLPRVVEEGKKELPITPLIHFDFIGLDKDAEINLSAHWKNFAQEFTITGKKRRETRACDNR